MNIQIRNNILKTLLLSSIFIHIHVAASDQDINAWKPLYSFSNISVNYLDWSEKTENNSQNVDFPYIELEGGVGYSWGDLYAFLDIENPLHDRDGSKTELRMAMKPILDLKVYNNCYLHLQDYYLWTKNFYVNNALVGIASKYTSGRDFLIRPFAGVHYQDSTYYCGYNGYMAGWFLNYNFQVSKENFSLSQWHEFEFSRDKEHYQLSDGTPIGDGKSSINS